MFFFFFFDVSMCVLDASLIHEANSWGLSCALQTIGQCWIGIVDVVLISTMRIHKRTIYVFGMAAGCLEGTRILKTKHGKEDIWVVMSMNLRILKLWTPNLVYK